MHMIYRIIQPAAYLQAFIKDYTLFHFVSGKNDSIPVKPFPANTQHCMVFYLRGTVRAFEPKTGLSTIFAKTAINGSQIARYDFHIAPNYLMFSVHFQPGALAKFLRLPLTDFTDARIDAEAILNPEIHQVHEQMANASSYESILQIIQAYLWQRIQSLKTDFQPINKVACLVSENPNKFSIEKMADHTCLSISQFERRFAQQLGITPKLYVRINRFYQAYSLKEKHPNLDWLSIALQTGYHDYQHLVKDFKQFSYATPHSLLLAQAQAPEKILGVSI